MVYRYLDDIKQIFNNSEGCQNTLIYTYDNDIPVCDEENLLYGKTILYPGKINGEYFMTKGHNHINACAEIYYGLQGEGIVVCQQENVIKEYPLTKDSVVYVPSNWAHRVVNTSNISLEFLCVCRADAGHDYNINFSKRYYEKEI